MRRFPKCAVLLMAVSSASFACAESPFNPTGTDGGRGDAQQRPDAGSCTTAYGASGSLVRAFFDLDGDGHAGSPREICVAPGRPLPSGYSHTRDDCDELSRDVWSTQLFYPDRDHDGAGEEPAESLCASAPPLNYYATASDCAPDDATRWRLLPFSYLDEDGDGHAAQLTGKVCAGLTLPAGYSTTASELDCDDRNAAAWALMDAWRDSDGDGFGAGAKLSVCAGDTLPKFYSARDGDCDDHDAAIWQLLSFAYRDADGDSYDVAMSGSICAGNSLPKGFATSYNGLIDCDDSNSSVGPASAAYLDEDGDGFGNGPAAYLCSAKSGYVSKVGDCAPGDAKRWQLLPYEYRDGDGDGFSVPLSGQICAGSALPPGYSTVPGKLDCDDSNAAAWALMDGWRDSDGDGSGAGTKLSVCTGDTLPKFYSARDGDCDDYNAAIWQLLSFAYRDADGDSYDVAMSGSICAGSSLPKGFATSYNGPIDCDDSNSSVGPASAAYLDEDGDGVGDGPAAYLCSAKSGYVSKVGDCAPGDAKRWQLLPYEYRDGDGDGFSVPLSGQICAGSALPPGYSTVPGKLDCDDSNAAAWALMDGWRDGDLDGYGAGPKLSVCAGNELPKSYSARDGDCDDHDAAIWQLLSFGYRDADGDSYDVAMSGSICAGSSLPKGFATSYNGLIDCDDSNSSAGPASAAYLDEDGDGLGDGPAAYQCSLEAGYASRGGDCAPEDSTRWQMLSYWYRDVDGDGWTVRSSGDICAGRWLPTTYSTTPGDGSDCDDGNASLHTSLAGYADQDGDRYGAGPLQDFCTPGALPEGYVLNNYDCDPDDADRWRIVANLNVDRDGDGYTVPESGALCIGANLPSPYVAAANGSDCNDADSSGWHWVIVYPDRDNDGVGAPPRQFQCLGTAIPPGFSTGGWDSNDGDPHVQWDPDELELVLAE